MSPARGARRAGGPDARVLPEAGCVQAWIELSTDDANAVIMAARAHWFEDEKKA